jgi:hypothetical protein
VAQNYLSLRFKERGVVEVAIVVWRPTLLR